MSGFSVIMLEDKYFIVRKLIRNLKMFYFELQRFARISQRTLVSDVFLL